MALKPMQIIQVAAYKQIAGLKWVEIVPKFVCEKHGESQLLKPYYWSF